MTGDNLGNLEPDSTIFNGLGFNGLEDLASTSLKGRTPEEVAEFFLDIPFSTPSDPARIAIREYVERQPQEFVDKFNSYILSKTQPIREEFARTSGDYELDCA